MTADEVERLQCLTALRNYLHGAPMNMGTLAYQLRRTDQALKAARRSTFTVKDDDYYMDLACRLNERLG